MLLDAVKRFAEGDLQPAARDADEKAALPPELIEKGWELGILQASIPEDYDGFGEYSCLTGVLAAEGFAYGDLSITLAVQTPNLFVLPIFLVGSEEQKKEFIPPVIEAEWKTYTAALIGSTPVLGESDKELTTIPGSVPNLINLPPGCKFAPRCQARIDNDLERCTDEEPDLKEVAANHWARCWLYQ